jgi:Zn-dependent peptidase ImmA (M78 family)
MIEQPDHCAERILRELNITKPEDLQPIESVAIKLGLIIREGKLSGAEARLTTFSKKGVITLSNTIIDSRRRRFSIAHEIGHFILHQREMNLNLCKPDDISQLVDEPVRNDHEKDANIFASAFLLPEFLMEPLCKAGEPTIGNISKISDIFEVSLTATSIRYAKLCDDAVIVIGSKGGYIKWYSESALFGEVRRELRLSIDLKTRLNPETLLSRLMTEGKSITNRKQVPLSAWFEHGGYKHGATLCEESLLMQNYGTALSLLWLNEADIETEIKDNDEEDPDEHVPSWNRKREW